MPDFEDVLEEIVVVGDRWLPVTRLCDGVWSLNWYIRDMCRRNLKKRCVVCGMWYCEVCWDEFETTVEK